MTEPTPADWPIEETAEEMPEHAGEVLDEPDTEPADPEYIDTGDTVDPTPE